MLKYYDVAVTFAEFPDEIALCINITNCPGLCEHCSEPWLREDKGTELTFSELEKLIDSHPGITLVGFMGGDSDHEYIEELVFHCNKLYPNLKFGMYSGMDMLDINLLNCLDCYKIGHWIMPRGEMSEWHKKNCGPLTFPWSNQLYFERTPEGWVNATNKFRQKPINDLSKEIIK